MSNKIKDKPLKWGQPMLNMSDESYERIEEESPEALEYIQHLHSYIFEIIAIVLNGQRFGHVGLWADPVIEQLLSVEFPRHKLEEAFNQTVSEECDEI